MNLYNRHFSHIYIEEEAYDYPLSSIIINNLNSPKIIRIEDYQQIFSRKLQSFDNQKKSKNLIIAVKNNDFLYDGSHFAQNAGYNNFYYNTLMLNCIYDCEYCYLQGMFSSSNMVLFVNVDDYFTATKKTINSRPYIEEPLFLSISYDTDLLAFENIAPYCSQWIDFARENNQLIIEIRTKSSNFKSISHYTPTDQVLLSWTLSPDEIVSRHEHQTPPLANRLSAVRQAIDTGWRPRLCFDPVIATENWKDIYKKFIERVFDSVNVNQIFDVTVGTFRMSSDHLRLARKRRPKFSMLQQEWEVRNGIAALPLVLRKEVTDFITLLLLERLPESKITIWT